MHRTYVQKARAQAAAETRRAILDAARVALLSDGALGTGVGAIASAAGVARSTVYAIFGTRTGLLAALADETLARAGFDEVLAEYGDPDAVRAVERSLHASCRMYAADRDAFARLIVLAQLDPDAAASVDRSQRDRSTGMDLLAARLEAEGRLRDGVTAARAGQVLSVLTGFWAFDELFTGRGVSAVDAADILGAMFRDSLVAS